MVRHDRFAGGSDGGGFFLFIFFLPWFMVVSGCGVDVDVQVSFCCDFFLLVVAWVAGLWWLWHGWWDEKERKTEGERGRIKNKE